MYAFLLLTRKRMTALADGDGRGFLQKGDVRLAARKVGLMTFHTRPAFNATTPELLPYLPTPGAP